MKPKEDPELKAQQEAAQADQVESLQETVTRRTNDSIRRYGVRTAFAGTGGVPLLNGANGPQPPSART